MYYNKFKDNSVFIDNNERLEVLLVIVNQECKEFTEVKEYIISLHCNVIIKLFCVKLFSPKSLLSIIDLFTKEYLPTSVFYHFSSF